MNEADAIDLVRDGVWTAFLVTSPMLAVGMIVGISIALLQALTQVQEMTLVFVPKIVAIFLTLLIALPFMAQALQGFMILISEKIVTG